MVSKLSHKTNKANEHFPVGNFNLFQLQMDILFGFKLKLSKLLKSRPGNETRWLSGGFEAFKMETQSLIQIENAF